MIDVYVHRLREKIDKGFSEKLLHTVRGAGYVLRTPEFVPSSSASASASDPDPDLGPDRKAEDDG